ncbi:MAG: hypothetical protein ACM37W_03885 [Actinomycetota bacterium]
MTPQEITATLQELFGAVDIAAPNSWQVETGNCRLLVLLSEDVSWLRILVPIATIQEAQQFLEPLLEANFDVTQETRYALHQNVVWGVFQHSFESLMIADFITAVKRLLSLHQRGLSDFFSELVETRIRQIIQAAKRQGQSLEATLQTLERFYAEGLMGEINMGHEAREQTLAAWRRQLERLWSEVE